MEDGRVIGLGGDPDHPFTRGFLCHKVVHYDRRLYSPLRVLYPARRVGVKGEGRFARISWDEALDEIASRFQDIAAEYGGEAILPYSYGGSLGVVQRNAGHRFFYRLGASRLLRTICDPAAMAGWEMTIGKAVSTTTHGDHVLALKRFSWFSIEFGLIEEAGEIKVFGAGILSSTGEIPFSLSAEVKRRPFVTDQVIETDYDPSRMQDQLFIIPSFAFVRREIEQLVKRFGIPV